jgi:hypothetical protein
MADTRFSTLGKYQLTATPDTPDFRDFIYQPALIQLKPYLRRPANLHILDQGSEGACTGFGLAAVINLLNHQRGNRYNVSPRMLYEMARRYDEWPGETYSGSSCRGAIRGWYAMGVCRDTEWRYNPSNPGELTIHRAKQARKNTLGTFFRLRHRISDFHAALNEVRAIFVSARVHPGWETRAVKRGEIPFRSDTIGGHAFAIIGYTGAGFLVQNSWGKSWGNNGVALWRYEDWKENIRDAWVFRLALPTPQIWNNPPNQYSALLDDPRQLGRSPTRGEIAGHFVHLDDGHFHQTGRYWSSESDTSQTAELVARSRKYKHLLLYAHGGINSPKDSATRISAMRHIFKANGIYPYHIMYDTGLLEEIKDVVFSKKKRAEERVAGFTDWTDKLLERATRVPGRALWREMKSGASSPFDPGGAGLSIISAFIDAYTRRGVAPNIHLAGHSTGAILMAHLLKALEGLSPGLRVRSCSLMAPATTVDLFKSHYRHLLTGSTSFGIDRMTIYNLNSRLEQDDNVARIYRKSLLYLVSRAFEEKTPAPILGIQRYNQPLLNAAPGRLEFVYSQGVSGVKVRTAATSHGGFDNDPATLNDILRNVLGAKPKRPFRNEDLKY